MHDAHQLKKANLQIKIGQQNADLDAVFPNGHKYNHYGFLIPEPYGSFGASLLIQAAIVDPLVRTESFRGVSVDEMFALLAGF